MEWLELTIKLIGAAGFLMFGLSVIHEQGKLRRDVRKLEKQLDQLNYKGRKSADDHANDRSDRRLP